MRYQNKSNDKLLTELQELHSFLNAIPVFSIMLSIFLLFSSCQPQPKATGPNYSDVPSSQTIPVYHFAVHPLHNPTKLTETYQPLMDYLNEKLKTAQLTLEASIDYAHFEEKYTQRDPDFLLPNPWQTIQAMKLGYSVVAMAGLPDDFKGIFIVRRDGSIRYPSDLKGTAVSYPAPTALAACIMPQYFLYEHGIDVNTDIQNLYVGSQESSIMNVYLGKTAAGATWPPPWRAFQKNFPAEAAQMKVIWETEPLINNSVMVRDDVPADVSGLVQKYLLELYETPEGQEILSNMETSRFLPANNKDYEIVKIYLECFEKEVRKVEIK